MAKGVRLTQVKAQVGVDRPQEQRAVLLGQAPDGQGADVSGRHRRVRRAPFAAAPPPRRVRVDHAEDGAGVCPRGTGCR